MELKRINGGASWLLDNRYEIHHFYNNGYGIRFVDRHRIVKNPAYNDKDEFSRSHFQEMIPQEHIYFSGGGLSSAVKGLHNVLDVQRNNRNAEDKEPQ